MGANENGKFQLLDEFIAFLESLMRLKTWVKDNKQQVHVF